MSLRIYRGDPLSLAAEVTLKVDGVVQPSLTGVTVEATLLSSTGSRVDRLLVTPAGARNVLLEATGASTSRWPTGKAAIRLRLTMPDGQVVRSPLVQLDIAQEAG